MSAQSCTIAIAERPAQITRCFDVMRELRQHITSAEEFLERVTRLQEQGYILAFLEADG